MTGPRGRITTPGSRAQPVRGWLGTLADVLAVVTVVVPLVRGEDWPRNSILLGVATALTAGLAVPGLLGVRRGLGVLAALVGVGVAIWGAVHLLKFGGGSTETTSVSTTAAATPPVSTTPPSETPPSRKPPSPTTSPPASTTAASPGSQRRIILLKAQAADLDAGRQARAGDSGADVWLDNSRYSTRYLITPLRGGLAEWTGSGTPSAKECGEALDGAAVPAIESTTGTAFCASTSEGGVAFARVTEERDDGVVLAVTRW
ncbi:hypothetical protein AB0F52_46235 [Amycolatopsis sp. NPDC024027]|uniref:hypothetical protein n=1 Tax=Amycolatopsis sp. NPDC024027 TaxID=3154327 RepID=UPI0033FB154A